MNQQQILQKAITKATENGWKYEYNSTFESLGKEFKQYEGNIYELLFTDKSFAKALWGEEVVHYFIPDDNNTAKTVSKLPLWKHHLRRMVIADDPIKYLEEHM